MWTLTHKAFVAMQTLRLRVCLPIQIKPVFAHIRAHFSIRENLSSHSPFRHTFLFCKNLFGVLICEFSKENWWSFFFKSVLAF